MANTEERGWWMDTSTVWPSLHSSFSVPITCGWCGRAARSSEHAGSWAGRQHAFCTDCPEN